MAEKKEYVEKAQVVSVIDLAIDEYKRLSSILLSKVSSTELVTKKMALYAESGTLNGIADAFRCSKDKFKNITAVDVVEVVRCRDCEYHFYDAMIGHRCMKHEIEVEPSDFCSFGSKEEVHT